MSILHRFSGILLFLAIPVFLWKLDRSLSGPAGYADVVQCLHSPFSVALLCGLLWAICHHLLAGIRYLLIDLDVGVDQPAYRQSASLVMILAPVMAVLLTWGLLL